MPKLIVYVKSSTWQRVVDQAGEGAAPLARALSVEAIEEFVAGLSERAAEDVGAGGVTSGISEGVSNPRREISTSPGDESGKPARSENSRPTPAECGMSNRHRMNSKLKPCPRCGYPL